MSTLFRGSTANSTPTVMTMTVVMFRMKMLRYGSAVQCFP